MEIEGSCVVRAEGKWRGVRNKDRRWAKRERRRWKREGGDEVVGRIRGDSPSDEGPVERWWRRRRAVDA